MKLHNMDRTFADIFAHIAFSDELKQLFFNISDFCKISASRLNSLLIEPNVQEAIIFEFQPEKATLPFYKYYLELNSDVKERNKDFDKLYRDLKRWFETTFVDLDNTTSNTLNRIYLTESETYDVKFCSDNEDSIVIKDFSILGKISEEIESRGNFELNIPKFVDLLFKLDVISVKKEE